MKLWNVATQRETMIFRKRHGQVSYVAFSQEKDSALLIAGCQEKVCLWRASSFHEIEERQRNEANP